MWSSKFSWGAYTNLTENNKVLFYTVKSIEQTVILSLKQKFSVYFMPKRRVIWKFINIIEILSL